MRGKSGSCRMYAFPDMSSLLLNMGGFSPFHGDMHHLFILPDFTPFVFLLQPVIHFPAFGRQRSFLQCLTDGASRFVSVGTVRESALADQFRDVGKSTGYSFIRIDYPQFPQTGGINQEHAVQFDHFPVGSGVPAF